MGPTLIFTELKLYLSNPKFIHVILTWGQAWGMLFGLLLLILGKWGMKDPKMLKLGMIILACMGALSYGIQANGRTAKPETMYSVNAENRKALESWRTDNCIIYYVFAVICILNIMGRFDGDSAKWFFLAMFFGAIALTCTSFWYQLRESLLVYGKL